MGLSVRLCAVAPLHSFLFYHVIHLDVGKDGRSPRRSRVIVFCRFVSSLPSAALVHEPVSLDSLRCLGQCHCLRGLLRYWPLLLFGDWFWAVEGQRPQEPLTEGLEHLVLTGTVIALVHAAFS